MSRSGARRFTMVFDHGTLVTPWGGQEAEMAVDTIEARLANLERSSELINTRLGSIELRLNGLDARMDRLDARMDRLDDKMDRQFYWLLGLLVISILLPMAMRYLPAP